MRTGWDIVARLMLDGKRAQMNRPTEYTAVESLARGQLCVVDPVTRTVRPALVKSRAAQLEEDLKGV